ncbi:MAG: hypothetical protein JRJ73_15545, partial [Deltaproteobacteria bacterium]|nr:hypothetical protein [Deltaproteobacteria bacterium]
MVATNQDLDNRIQTLAQLMYEAKRLVVFTGAGISTDSGLPDFRGPDGVWTRRDKGLTPTSSKVDWTSVEPNQGHMAIMDLFNCGKLYFLISQNIDNLHIKSGIPVDIMAELHGNLAKFRCINCEKTFSKSEGVEKCECGGSLKSSVVD